MGTGEPALDHLASVEQQVPPIGNLHGAGRTQRCAACVLGRTVPRQKADLRLAPQP